ncbi:hypothetical protein FQN49_006210 [Arthroderma sp. PD_2]|nr:hypothetical protein FQN49_006210 [Arthroderma sp. PD_2]
MADSLDLQTVTGRLATFDVAHQSGSGGETTWPYTTPSPDELAHAGFYYTPTTLSPDNATCFLCERSLDGWEEGDDAFAEHLRFSPQCGWAIMMNIALQTSDPEQIEDPTKPEIADARRATFFSWPHDGKRGWVCKTEKMVEAGWYFCPNEESDDLVSCPYCKLSLDGWEPKDNPFDEHHRRSSDCSFFEFAKQPKKGSKSGRGKAVRGSKASRQSTQSNVTTASEAPTVDFDDAMDQSMMSQSATRTSKAPKKTTKSKARGTKSKIDDEVDVPSQLDTVEQHGKEDSILHESPSRGTKRKSEAISGIGGNNSEGDIQPQPEPKPKKKRVTATRAKKAQRTTNSTVDYAEPTDDELGLEVAPKKRGRKKGSTSKARKASTASNASTAPLKSQIPNDEEIDAELEADLDKDLPTNTMTSSAVENAPSQQRLSSTASIAPVRRKVSQHEDVDELPKQEPQKKSTTKKKTTKKQPSTSSTDKLPASDRGQPPPVNSEADEDMDEPVVSIPIQPPEIKAQSEEPAAQPKKAKQSKKAKATTSNAKGRKKKADSNDVKDTATAEMTAPTKDTAMDKEEPVARMTKGRDSSKGMKTEVDERHRRQESTSQRLDTNTQPQNNPGSTREPPVTRRPSKQVQEAQASPPTVNPSTHLSPRDYTPSPSLQSSDAENQPPSSRPSTMSRAHPHTTSQPIKAPLATRTPVLSPSKETSHSRQLATADPWDPVDLDEAFLPDPTEKENLSLTDILHAAKDGLTSPEKRMNIEEWIFWNAEKGEEKLRGECERVVGVFEREGGRAMHALDGIECID